MASTGHCTCRRSIDLAARYCSSRAIVRREGARHFVFVSSERDKGWHVLAPHISEGQNVPAAAQQLSRQAENLTTNNGEWNHVTTYGN